MPACPLLRLRTPPEVVPRLIELPPAQALRLKLRAGETLRVHQGLVWMTRTGDPQDHVLGPGQGFVAPRHQEWVLQACGPCVGSLTVQAAWFCVNFPLSNSLQWVISAFTRFSPVR